MTKVFTSPSLPEVEMLRGLLEGESIPCILRNQNTATLANGRIPFTDNWPELWVLREADADAAHRLLNTPAQMSSAWQCPQCGEENEGQFTACWNCSEDRPQPGGKEGQRDA